MQARTKIRLIAFFSAVAVTAALAAAIGPVANGAMHLFHHAFDALSPEGQRIARAIGRSVPWMSGLVVALLAGVIGWRHERWKEESEAPGGTAPVRSPGRAGRLP